MLRPFHPVRLVRKPAFNSPTWSMTEPERSTTARRPFGRVLTAVIVGLLGAVVIWVATPYNNFVIRSQYIADIYLPTAALFLLLLLVLGVNPLLRKLAPSLVLNKWQLAVAMGVFLVACVVPSSGLMRMLPYSIARVPMAVRDNEKLGEAYREMDLPKSLFPAETGYKKEVPASEHFLDRLPEGEPVPWDAWAGPLVSWGSFLLFCWLMMIGLSLIVLPQWRRNERLPFPLLTVQESLIETPQRGRLFAPLFRRRSFWVAAGAVFLLHFMAGLKQYNPAAWPAIPLDWNLTAVFADSPLRHLPGHIKSARIYFMFLGIAFFMPNRIGFSIWFFELAYAVYRVIGREYVPHFYRYDHMYDHRIGAMIALTLFVLWLGRAHWLRVLRSDSRSSSPEERRNVHAGTLFSLGCAGMYFWLLWAGVPALWAVFYVGIGFMVSLLITRMVAETGMPFIRIDFRYRIGLVKLAPFAWLSPVVLFFSAVIAVLFPTASRVSAATMGAHALGLDEDAGPRFRSRMAWLLVGVLVLGFVISGGTHIFANYHHSMSLDGVDEVLSPWGTTRVSDPAHQDIREWQTGRTKEPPGMKEPDYFQVGHLAFGALLAGLLEWACLSMPRWPFHPIGLLMTGSFYANQAWVSVLFGWLIKILLVRYGGARLYRAMRPVFLGIIMGEVFAAVYWSIEPSIRVFLGQEYTVVHVLPK
jgi:hypothetical protein